MSLHSLPAFEFNPSVTDGASQSSGSATSSPTRSLPISTRSGGHRRGGSEFIGGDGSVDGPGLMSTSPTKGGGTLPSPAGVRQGPPGGRRGHAHRRSGAVSHHDLSAILKPPHEVDSRSGSAPTTPSEIDNTHDFSPTSDKASSQLSLVPSQSPPLPSPSRGEVLSGLASPSQPRPRVGFSETVEFIPRPLSTVSSETSSSMSTIRAAHSVTNSISSVVSAGTYSPPSGKRSLAIFETPFEEGVTNDSPEPAYNASEDNDMETTSHDPKSSSQLGGRVGDSCYIPIDSNVFSFGKDQDLGLQHDPPPEDDEISPVPPSSQYSAADHDFPQVTAGAIQRASSARRSSPAFRPKTSTEPKITKRQRKARSWGSLLSRNAKSQSLDQVMQNVPVTSSPLRESAPLTDTSIDDMVLSEATRGIFNDQSHQRQQTRIDFSNWKPLEPISPYLANQTETESDGSILDLDAAIASPTSCNSGIGSDQTAAGFSSAKRRMHSSGNTGSFYGPGMHYHRRAESAPEMAPIDRSSFGVHRLGSSPSMADVFEEEEEEDDMTEKQGSTQVKPRATSDMTDLHGLGVQITDINDGGAGQSQRRPRLQESRSAGTVDSVSPMSKEDSDTQGYFARLDDGSAVEIVESTEEPRFSMVTKSSDDSTITPTLSIGHPGNGQMPEPTDFAFPTSNHQFQTPETVSSVSSPDIHNTSFDVPRLNTATSSITDRTNWSSPRPGEPGHKPTYSTEDVPSLTSSASTMISGHPSRFSTSAETRASTERSSSVSGVVPARTGPVSAYKRSSLASLSRLVGSSYGEKSKLSIASSAPSDETEKRDKKKGNRISRLMRFWKSKEKLVDS